MSATKITPQRVTSLQELEKLPLFRKSETAQAPPSPQKKPAAIPASKYAQVSAPVKPPVLQKQPAPATQVPQVPYPHEIKASNWRPRPEGVPGKALGKVDLEIPGAGLTILNCVCTKKRKDGRPRYILMPRVYKKSAPPDATVFSHPELFMVKIDPSMVQDFQAKAEAALMDLWKSLETPVS
jgi:hypothetical protein